MGMKRRFLRTILTLVTVLGIVAVAVPWTTFADNVVNDLNADVSYTVGGSAAVVNYWLVATNAAPDVNGCNVDSTHAATVAIVVPAGVTATPASLSFTSCGTGSKKPVSFTATAAGSYAVSATVTGGKTGSVWNTTPAGFTLNVTGSSGGGGGGGLSADITPPTVNCGSPDGLWHSADVSISCTASDPDVSGATTSGLASPADASFTLSTSVAAGSETSNAATGSRLVCDNAGNCSQAGPISGNKVDKKAPTAAPTQSPAANGDGWNNSDVTVTWNWSDGGSGVDPANCTTSSTSSGEGNPISLNASCKDLVGNAATASASVKVDKTAPTFVSGSVSPNPVVLNGAATATATFSDNLSGVKTSGCNTPVTSNVGTWTVTCSATDYAGNLGSGSISYKVTYGVVALYDQTKVAKLGSTIPIKVRLVDANGNNVSSSAITVNATKVTLKSTGADGAVADSGNANPDSNFRYDATLGGYIFNLSTKGLSAGSYSLTFAATGDPVGHSVDFAVK